MAQHSISSAFCMYGSELLGGLQPPEPPPRSATASKAPGSKSSTAGEHYLEIYINYLQAVRYMFGCGVGGY